MIYMHASAEDVLWHAHERSKNRTTHARQTVKHFSSVRKPAQGRPWGNLNSHQ